MHSIHFDPLVFQMVTNPLIREGKPVGMPRNSQSYHFDDMKEYVALLVKTLEANGLDVPEQPSVTRQRLEQLAQFAKDNPDHPYVYYKVSKWRLRALIGTITRLRLCVCVRLAGRNGR
jgi:hypothetical protein